MNTKYKIFLFAVVALLTFGCKEKTEFGDKSLSVSKNGRYLETEDGKPFFWLGDTGWLLFSKLTREESNTYLEDRKQKGFNVIQVMVLHDVAAKNVYGDSALVTSDVSKPLLTEGNNPKDSVAYDYWDHVDYMVDKAAEKGLYMALVPVWGTNVKEKRVDEAQAKAYAAFLAKRYKDKWNIIWLNGGDIKGTDGLKVWYTIGETLRANDPNHLITFHPRGRTASSQWFHNAKWNDFDMVQSGHRRYDQDTSKNEKLHYGEDNWRYMEADYKLKPTKPTIDGEPSYEDIPQGLHDTLQLRWTDADVRRYGYWSVFAGAFGYTYGHNSVMQMYKKTDPKPAYGPKDQWITAINAPGAKQMKYLKELMLSRSYFDRIPDQTLVAGKNGEKYDRVMATRGEEFAMLYTYTGRNFSVQMGKVDSDDVKASWFDPRTGKFTTIGEFENKGIKEFDPPGEPANGNDWVLVLDKI
ncbi:glycoside hydrolase family 140 protein [Pedobacter endophyticus]|uniref:Glycoside hydrolase family 140 protein n=1 Tax=Pedobacter endophyticus TaxID=2789740 RepID=A0A7S9L0F6_9SPHI|nr:glycoside hydrolase family 140 protein [Pedobacter endophyticus]QPH40232.1 glycoside hydrolase family 140 protein [Pedobacter endophyticus]